MTGIRLAVTPAIPHYFGPYPNYANSPMPTGSITSITLESGGEHYSTLPNVTIIDVYGTGSGAIATINVTAGVVTDVTLHNGGTGYSAPIVVITDATGSGAVATASIGGPLAGGIRKFVDTLPGLNIAGANNLGSNIPIAIPDTTSYPPGGIGYTSAHQVIINDTTGSGATAIATVAGGTVTGVTITNPGSGYSAIPVVSFSGGGAPTNAIGKATVTGGAITGILQPDATELGWKEIFKTSPLEDTIVALRPVAPSLPFEIPNSIHLIDPTMPEGVVLYGPALNGFVDPQMQPVTVINHMVNYGWEYVWHCHILAHEEMDMMHSMLFAVAPVPPINLNAVNVSPGSNLKVDVSWTDNSIRETGFYVLKSTIRTGPWATIAYIPSTTGPQKGARITYTDTTGTPGTNYYYCALASNLIGDTAIYAPPSIGFPKMEVNSKPSDVAGVTVNHISTMGVFHNGRFELKNSNTNGPADISFAYGANKDTPVTGDWTGIGKDTAGVFRKGMFYLRNSNTASIADNTFNFGHVSDTPIAGDWNRDGKTEVGIFRNGMFALAGSNTNGGGTVNYFNYGQANDVPVTGDWNGDGITEVGIFRNGMFALVSSNTNGGGTVNYFNYGLANDIPVAGYWV